VGDAALAHVIFLTGAAMLGLVASLVGELRPAWLVGFVLAAGWVLVVGTYLVAFWTVAGQTPGMRLLRLRLLGPVEIRRPSGGRCCAYQPPPPARKLSRLPRACPGLDPSPLGQASASDALVGAWGKTAPKLG
jgi:hypothetical protein